MEDNKDERTHYWDWDYEDPSYFPHTNIRLYSPGCEPLTTEELDVLCTRHDEGFNGGPQNQSGYQIPIGSRYGDLELLDYLPPTTYYEKNRGRWRIVPVGRWKCHNCGNIIDKNINRVTSKPSGRAAKIKNCGCRNPYRKQGEEINKCQVTLPQIPADVSIDEMNAIRERKNSNRINGVPINVLNSNRTKIPVGRTFEEALELSKSRKKRAYETKTDVIYSKVRFDPATRYNTPFHKLSEMPEYVRWNGMHVRCENPASDEYHNYGARGITVCSEWSKHREDGMGFINYLDWLKSAKYFDVPFEERPFLHVDREHNDSGYSPENCRLVPIEVNARNTRKNLYIPDVMPNGDVVPMVWADFTDGYGLDRNFILSKVANGWSLNAILFAAHNASKLKLHRRKGSYHSEFKDQPGEWYYQLIPRVISTEEEDEWNRMIERRNERNRQYRENRKQKDDK